MDELDYELHLDHLSIQEIYNCIDEGSLTRQEVIDHYNNQWWDETHEEAV